MKKAVIGLTAVGVALLAGGFVYDAMFAGIPYPDPTPELAARYARHAAIAGWLGRIGLALAVAGAGLALVRAGMRRLEPRE